MTAKIYIFPDQRIANNAAVILKPTSYSECQTIQQIIDKLTKYPEQCCNTPQIFDGLGVEFVPFHDSDPDQSVGLLSEFYETEHVHNFFVKTNNGGIMAIERLINGQFVVTEAFDENNKVLVSEIALH